MFITILMLKNQAKSQRIVVKNLQKKRPGERSPGREYCVQKRYSDYFTTVIGSGAPFHTSS